MSELLGIAARLRKLDAQQLAELISPIGSIGTIADIFDLARAMIGKRELERRIRQVSKTDLELLSEAKSSQGLVTSYLADESAAFPSAVAVYSELAPVELKKPKMDTGCGSLTNYETQLAITELLFACERHFLESIKQGLRAQDAREIAQVLKLDIARLQLIFQLALESELVANHEGRYIATASGLKWLELDPAQRWELLVQRMWDLPEIKRASDSFVGDLLDEYPLLDPNSSLLLKFGHLLGLLDQFRWTDLLVSAMVDKGHAAMQVQLGYPAPASRIIVQSDLTIVAPGPLSPQTHRQLDLIAQSEDLGLACRFRVSMNSILHAMETGLSGDEIAELISSLSSSDLPQPLTYLIAQSQKKFGELRVLSIDSGAVVLSDDSITLTQIRNEAALAPLMFKELPGGLTSRLSQELIYFNLRDNGYPAIMVDEYGEVISPRAKAIEQVELQLEPGLEIAKALISNESKSPGIDDHLRQLEFALKNKLQVGIRVEMPDGVVEFEMTPLGISGGRFRGRDVVKEAERTLPLSRIQAVWLS